MELSFKKSFNSNSKKTMEILADFGNYEKFFPYIKECKITTRKNNYIITEEILFIGGRNFRFKQKSHHQVSTDSINTKTLSGPLAGSELDLIFKSKNNQTTLFVKAKLKLNLKYRIFSSFLKKKYRLYLDYAFEYVNELLAITADRSWCDCLTNDGECLILSKPGFENVRLFSWWKSEMNEIFNEEIYQFLPVNNKIVVDVGANICDSSIYFGKKNAKKIIAIEPFPMNIEIGKKNILSNGLSDKIELLHTACTDKIKRIKVDNTLEGSGLHTNNPNFGTEIQTITLEKIVNDYNLDSAILKMDCEDCEYESILSSKNTVLNSFSHILIEYHHGYKQLLDKLKASNFHVSVESKRITKKKDRGYLYCTKIV